MTLLGLAPFIATNSKPPRLRVYVPFIVYTLCMIVLMPIIANNYVHELQKLIEKHQVWVQLIAQYARFFICCATYTLVLLASAGLATEHVQFLNTFDAFHERVCDLDPNQRRPSFIMRLIGESMVFNALWTAALLHMYLKFGQIVDAVANCLVVFLPMAIMFHLISMVRLMGHDLRSIRRHLSVSDRIRSNGRFHDEPGFVLLEQCLEIKQTFESVFGKTIACCAAFEFVVMVVVVYMMTVFLIYYENTWWEFIEGALGFICPVVVKNVMLSTACCGIANEV